MFGHKTVQVGFHVVRIDNQDVKSGILQTQGALCGFFTGRKAGDQGRTAAGNGNSGACFVGCNANGLGKVIGQFLSIALQVVDGNDVHRPFL